MVFNLTKFVIRASLSEPHIDEFIAIEFLSSVIRAS